MANLTIIPAVSVQRVLYPTTGSRKWGCQTQLTLPGISPGSLLQRLQSGATGYQGHDYHHIEMNSSSLSKGGLSLFDSKAGEFSAKAVAARSVIGNTGVKAKKFETSDLFRHVADAVYAIYGHWYFQ